MAYKCRGRLDKKIKACEMSDNDFSIVTLTKKFSELCGGSVAVQYKGRTLLTDNDVKSALDDCYAQKKLFLEVDLILGGSGGAAVAQPVVSAPPPQQQRAVVPPVATSTATAPAVDQAANQLLSKYGLGGTSPRQNQTPVSQPPRESPRSYAAPAPRQESPRTHVNVTPAPAPTPVTVVTRQPAPVPAGYARLQGGLEADFRSEINRLRTSPSSFVPQLEARLAMYEGATLRMKRGAVMFRSQTHEGAKACSDSISYLRSTRPVGAVEFCYGLCEAARDIVDFMGPEGQRKPSPQDMATLIEKHGVYEGTLSQVIAYVYEDDVLATMQDLLICDGDSSRHTATLLMGQEYKFAGLAVGPASGARAPRLVVMQFVSDSWTDK